jgi:DNA polymerase-3 subunit epsilon
MKTDNKFLLFAGVSILFTFIVIASLGVLFWYQLTPEVKAILIRTFKQYFVYIFSAAFFLLAGLGFGLDWVFRAYILPINKLAEETQLINSVNPQHRIRVEGSRDIMRLAQIINEGADRYETLQKNVLQKIQFAKSETEEEKNILAAIISELPEGVLICNARGRILLYNKRAKQFLAGGLKHDILETVEDPESQPEPAAAPSSTEERFIGLGRPIFGLIDKHLIAHALDEIAQKLKHKEGNAVSCFVIRGQTNNLLRVEAVPILNHRRQFTGFILIFDDITRQIERDSRVNFLLQSLSTGIRSPLTSIRSAIEAILEYPCMDQAQSLSFRKIIHKESISLGNVLNQVVSDFTSHVQSRWPLVQMSAGDMIETLKLKAQEKLGIRITVDHCDEKSWVKVDGYSFDLAMLCVIKRLKQETGKSEYSCRLEKRGRYVNLDLVWKGKPIRLETLRKWDLQVLAVGNEYSTLILKEVMQHHEAAIWSYSDSGTKDKSYLRIFLPAIETPEPGIIRNLTILPKSRPEFYDFDMFNQPGQVPEIDQRSLTELRYTVFDTETTGLDPTGGDEIISIGAVRIVNGRLLHDDFFDQLIDPRRSVPWESTQIHGIEPAMLKGKPPIEKVLPLFYRFVGDTILVAHNAAFDMRMLQMKEDATGIKFINPVLDTMLISAVVHPAHKDHNIEAIAERLGVSIVGRHTALGDAIATSEIFLKFIPLMAKMGIQTLRDSRIASQKTYYARIKY